MSGGPGRHHPRTLQPTKQPTRRRFLRSLTLQSVGALRPKRDQNVSPIMPGFFSISLNHGARSASVVDEALLFQAYSPAKYDLFAELTGKRDYLISNRSGNHNPCVAVLPRQKKRKQCTAVSTKAVGSDDVDLGTLFACRTPPDIFSWAAVALC